MKVYIGAIDGHVPNDIVRTFSSFLEFCYLARRDSHSEKSINALNEALRRFNHLRNIFEATGVREGFSLPRQHAMVHYPSLIRAFSAPNGLCSSITESKHIVAVKEPWRRSSRFNALGQMLLTNQRLDKMATMHTDFTRHKMF
jgi:hypothetical protein